MRLRLVSQPTIRPCGSGKRKHACTTSGALIQRGAPGTPGTAGATAQWDSDQAHSMHFEHDGSSQEYNLTLSEVVHYSDESVVLVLENLNGEPQEAEYPIDIDEDTRPVLDEQGQPEVLEAESTEAAEAQHDHGASNFSLPDVRDPHFSTNGSHPAISNGEPDYFRCNEPFFEQREQDSRDSEEEEEEELEAESETREACTSYTSAVVRANRTLPDYQTRRQGNAGSDSGMPRRSSRHSANLLERIASLPVSSLAKFSMPTLRRICRDVGIEPDLDDRSTLLAKLHAVAHAKPNTDIRRERGATSSRYEVMDGRHRVQNPAGPVSVMYSSGQDGGVGEEDCMWWENGAGGRAPSTDHQEPYWSNEGIPVLNESRYRQGHERGNGHRASRRAHGPGHRNVDDRASWDQVHMLKGGDDLIAHAQELESELDVDKDFESLAALNLDRLRSLCEGIGVKGWQHMPKGKMISSLLLEVYGLN